MKKILIFLAGIILYTILILSVVFFTCILPDIIMCTSANIFVRIAFSGVLCSMGLFFLHSICISIKYDVNNK